MGFNVKSLYSDKDKPTTLGKHGFNVKSLYGKDSEGASVNAPSPAGDTTAEHAEASRKGIYTPMQEKAARSMGIALPKDSAAVSAGVSQLRERVEADNATVGEMHPENDADIKPTIISDYVPGAYNISKEEYASRRQSNPDMPEFGSYDYFKNREKELKPILDEIANDPDRTDEVYRGWAENYGKDNTWADGKPIQKIAKDLYEKFKYQDAILAEYKDIDAQLKKFDIQGVHYNSSSEIDAESGAKEAKYAKERLDAIVDATTFTGDEINLGYTGELPEKKQKEYDALHALAKQREVEAKKESAYTYYAKNKDNIYKDNLWGRLTGNYKVGRISIKANDAGFASYKASTGDIEAVEVYQALSERIQKRNNATFQNDNIAEEITAVVAQYAPQGVDQAVNKTGGSVVGAIIGWASGAGAGMGSQLGGSTAVANYIYQQTAGAAFVRLLQESDLSVEDAKLLAESEALASGAVEFGLDFVTSQLWARVGSTNAVKNTASELGEKALNSLMAKGISEKGAKTIISVAKNAGKLTIDSLGEGLEEWIQDGMAITSDKYAEDGEIPSAFELFIKAFDLRQYSKEDFDKMNQSFLAGTIIGYGHGGLNAVTSLGINKTISAVADSVDAEVLGEEINKSDGTEIITDAVEMAKDNVSPEVVKAVETVETAIAEDNTPPAEAVGTVVKSVLSEKNGAVSTENAQVYNIIISNLHRKAEELGANDRAFYDALLDVNIFSPSAEDKKLIFDEFSRVFAGNTDPLVANWLDAIRPVETAAMEAPTTTATTVAEASNEVRNSDATSELAEIAEADEVVRFTPKTAGDEIKRIESALISQGADDNSRREIVEMALGFSPETAESDKTVRDAFAEAVRLTSNTVANDKSAAEASGGYWRLLAENFKSLASPTRSVADTNAQTSHIDVQTAPVSVETASGSVKTAVSTADNSVTSEIVSLKRIKNVYSLFKGAARIVVGTDVVTDGYVAIPLTDEALAAVETFAPGTVQNNPAASLGKFYNRGNDVVISGDPKIDDIKVSGKTEKGYVFKIGDAYYSCQQKFIDAFNNGKNTITANKNVRAPWSVHNENGGLVAVFMGANHAMSDERFDALGSVSGVKALESQRKSDNATKPFNQNEVRQLIDVGTPFFATINGENYVGDGRIFVRCDEVAAEFIKNEYHARHANSNYEIEHREGFGGRVEKMLSESEVLVDVSDIAPYTGARKGEIAYPVGDSAMAFNKNYVDLIKKRSSAVKIVSNGAWRTTIIAGYDADGGIAGFALPVYKEGEITTADGKTVPFIKEDSIKRLVDGASAVAVQSNGQVLKTEQNRDIIEEKSTTEQTHADNIFTKEIGSNKKVAVQDTGRVSEPADIHKQFKRDNTGSIGNTPGSIVASDTATPSIRGTQAVSKYVAAKLANGKKITALELAKVANVAFGGAMADNAYTIKDAYDAMELGVNKHILSMEDVSAEKMLELLEFLPTQTKRTEDMVKYQQFSTPPSIAYLANYAANVNANDIMLEPSAGIGGIAVFAKREGASVYVNELDPRRLDIIKELPFDGFFNENAEQLDNILGGKIEPTVIVMNPPFSSSSERNIQNTKIGAKHVEQALKTLAQNGRLVAIVGHGMGDDAPAFRGWWKDIKSQYNVRANIRINGKNYNKYGTNFDIQMLVIDKNGATTHTETGFVDTLQELQDKLGGIRNERPVIDYSTNEQRTPPAARTETAQAGETSSVGNRVVSDAGRAADKGKPADNAIHKGQPERKSVQSADAERRASAVGETSNTNVVADGQPVDERGEQRGNTELRDTERSDAPTGVQYSEQPDVGRSGRNSGNGRNEVRVQRPKRRELTDSIFERYQTQPLKVKNAKLHPAKVSESAAMSAIEPPTITYKPNIPQSVIDAGVVSAVQLEAISYAGQSHSQTLPNGTTRGFFLGDGTGIGKGRTIAGMMLDNYNQGRKKSLWVTLNSSLVNDAKRDVKALFGTSDLVTQFVGGNKADSVLNTDEAVMVVSYSALSKGFDNGGSNFEKIVKWLGKDFDGLIVFDEAHKMGNATATKGTRGVKKASQTGLVGIALQEALPKAKIVYSSATGATEVENLRYAERLGLWGEGTAFATGDDFVSKIKAGGLAAMELIARDMKAMGVYLSRNISYEDVRYDKITHKLTAPQRAIYDELARSWQIVLNNIHKALETTNQGKDGTARGRALGAFWSSQQRFFNQILTSMQVPSVIADIEKQLADGKSCVIQLVSTNEAAQNDEFARLKAEDLELDEFDLTPKQMLMSYIENSFPVQQFEEYRDDEGNIRSKPVYDSQGNPVLNRDAVKQREELLSKLGSIKVPSSPIDMIINHFGTDLVAENTGRARRVIQKDGKFIEEKIANKKDADVDAFQNGNKRIIIFSKAGGTGKSYHADRAAKNQQQRVHYLLEAGWQADNAVQGFGRSHRSNQASAPIFKLVTTDLKGQMRFISTIAKRLDQLGAMTKGQRQAGGQGMFSASDNLENGFAADVLAVFYKDLVANRVDGINDGLAIIEKLGLKEKILDDYNRIIVTAPELREVNKFLNRILSLESTEQNTVFDGYSERLQDATEKAMLAGTLDKGLENYKADRITLNEVQDIREDERSGAKTKYYNLTAEHKIKPIQFGDIATDSKSFVGFYQSKTSGAVRAVMQTSSTTDQYGNVTSNYKLVGQVKNDYIPQNRFYGNWSEIKTEDAEKLWNEEITKLPGFRKENLHLISGVVLPVWDKLPSENVRIYRVLTSDGEMLIGRVIPEVLIDQTLRQLGSSRTKETIATKDLVVGIKTGDTVHLENGWKIVQRKVSGENRIEVVGPSYEHHDTLTKKGVFTERIQYSTRYFVPADTNTEKIVDEILKLSPVMRVESEKYTLSTESEGATNEKSGNSLLSGSGGRDLDASAGKQAARISAYKQKLEGKTTAERKDYAKELLEKGQTEEVIDGTHKYTLVKPEAYNDDMRAIVDEAKGRGKEVGFFIGNATRKFDGKREFKIDGIKIGRSKILLRYDGEYTPQTLLIHEDAHTDWDTPEMQNAKDAILDSISDVEKKKLLSDGRYKDYLELYENNPDAVWEEFVADVFAGMNDYTPNFIDVIADYYFGEQAIDRYNPREYNNIIDAGGNEAVLNDVGFGDDNRLPERGGFNGHEQTGTVGELGRLDNPGEDEGFARMDSVGSIQSAKPNTPHTKRVHRSGVSAETLTSSGLTAEQTALKAENRFDGFKTEFFTEARQDGVVRTKNFNTQNTAYYPDSHFERNDIVINNGVVSFTEKRLNDLIEDFSVPKGGQLNQNYAKGYVAYISPSDFLSLTTVNENKIVADTKTNEKYGSGKLDTEILSNTLQTPFLEIDFEEGVVTAHEGRHRMVMLRDAGAERVAIVIKDIDAESGKYRTEKLTDVSITGQEFSNGTAPGSVTLNEIIPLSPNYRAEVRAKFVENEASLRYTLSTAESDTTELTPERKKEIFEQYNRDRAEIEKPSLKQLWGERAAWVAHNMTRVFPSIPERGERGTFFAEFRKSMIQWKNLPTTASFMVQDKLNKMTEGLTPKEFKTFSELVYFLDLQEEAEIQRERGFTEILLPNEIAPAEVDAIVKVLNEEATENVKRALIKRQNIWDALKAQYIELNRYIGFDTDGKFKRKNYYHHQVIEYMNDSGKGTGSREIGIKAGRGWLKERQGSTKAINTDFLAVEYKAMLQMQYDVYIAETLGRIKQQYDIKPQLEEEAFRHNKQALNDIIRKEATDKDGNIVLDSKGKPDSETYRQQMWYNSRIMFGFSGLFDLADRGELPTYDGEYAGVVVALKRHDLNVSGLYKYVGVVASADPPVDATDAQEQAVMNARTVLKYTSQKKAWIKELLADECQTWETIAKSMSDTHTIHQPRRGNYFYTKTVVDEDAFNKAHNDMVLALASGEVDFGSVDLAKLFTQYADTVRLTGAAYEQWVLPNEIVTTMDEIANPKQASAGAKAARAIVSAWKGWATSVNPLRTVKFGIRNLYGDLDAVIAGNPKVVLHSKKAAQDIYRAMRHKDYSPEFLEWVERGGYTSMIFANEMDTEMQDKLFSHLKEKEGVDVFKIPVKLFEGYYNSVEAVHNFREAILRYSSYLYFKKQIEQNAGAVKDYAASNRYIVRGLNTTQDKAYQLSKDLLGAYDEVGKMGQTLRRYWVPFYSFTETNLKRYCRVFENIITSDDKIPKKAGKLLLKALMVNMLGLLMAAWNRLVVREEDDELPPSVRNVPHLTLGKIGDNIYAFRQLGSFSDILEWFGLEDYKWTPEDLMAPIDKAWGMVTPFLKMPVELVSGLNFYPSLAEPRAIRDKWQHFFNSFGVDDVYSEVTGKPTRGIGEILKGAFVYSYDYKESAYYEILDLKREFQGKTDNTIYGTNAKSNALYYMKTAVRYKDLDAALKYLDEYFENGGTVKGIKQSFSTLNPMYGFTSEETMENGKAFVASLTDEQREKLKIAQDFYENDLMLPETVLDKLGKKGITNEEAKNVLRNYIKSKCK